MTIQSDQSNTNEETTEVVVADNNDDNTIVNDVPEVTSIDDDETMNIVNSSMAATNVETNTTTEEVVQNITSDSSEDEQLENVSNKTFEDQSDTELLATILDNSNLAQTVMNTLQPYNYEPSVTDREQLGVMGKKEEDKSDAEKRADQIIAANKEEQEAISKNYMEADQSGILGAMAGDVDVSSYRSAILPDNKVWYKPEDIYKNVTYKDNARSLYFLEKGSTDTYKKMIEDQYK